MQTNQLINQGAETNPNYLPTPCPGCSEIFNTQCIIFNGQTGGILNIPQGVNLNQVISVIDNSLALILDYIENLTGINLWTNIPYITNSIVIHNQELFLSLGATLATDVPGISPLWKQLTCPCIPPELFTYTFEVTPSNAVITINGIVTDTFTGPAGSTIDVEVTATGYQNFSNTYTVNTDQTITIDLIPIVSYTFYWGEIGNIFAPNPSGISQANWDNLIKPDGTSGNMTEYTGTFQNNYERDSTGFNSQWWIVLIPTSQTTVVNDLPNYIWYTWDVLTSAWYVFNEHSPYTGTVTLDGINYTYSAIRPGNSNKIKYSKLP